MLNIQHLTKTYSGKKAVDDLSLHIAPGEIYGFIGHNGAGKTTTLRCVVGASCNSTPGRSPSAASPSAPTPSPASGSWPISPITPTCTTT